MKKSTLGFHMGSYQKGGYRHGYTVFFSFVDMFYFKYISKIVNYSKFEVINIGLERPQICADL